MAESTAKRIAYIDWVRGFACVMMFQTHCYDSWLGGAGRIAAVGDTHDVRRLRNRSIGIAIAAAAIVAVVTPLLWTTWQPHWRAWWLESYINGVHTFGTPQAWLFPLFPWSAFAFAGLAAGFLLQSDGARRKGTAAMVLAGAGGVGFIALGIWLDAPPRR